MKLTATKTGVQGRKTVRGPGFSIEVTKKTADVEQPARGFIECKDVKLSFYKNSAQQIVGIELTTGEGKNRKTQMFKDPHPFVMWSQAENWLNIYLSDLREAEEQVPDKLAGLGKKRIKKTTTKK